MRLFWAAPVVGPGLNYKDNSFNLFLPSVSTFTRAAVIDDIFGLFYAPEPKDYDAALGSLDYFLSHISDILKTDGIETGDFEF